MDKLGVLSEEDYIYLDKSGNPHQLVDIYAHWNAQNSVVVTINQGESLSFLRLKICEAFEQYSYLQGLSGFSVDSLRAFSREVPLTGRVKDLLKSDDHVYCQFISEDQWIDVSVNCIDFLLSIDFSIKVKRNANVHSLQKMILECALEVLKRKAIGKIECEYTLDIKKVHQIDSFGKPCKVTPLKIEDAISDHFDYVNRFVLCCLRSKNSYENPRCLRNSVENFEEFVLPFMIRGLKVEKVQGFNRSPSVYHKKTSFCCFECQIF